MACVVAMQKVVGSNPISRFEVNPLHTGNDVELEDDLRELVDKYANGFRPED